METFLKATHLLGPWYNYPSTHHFYICVEVSSKYILTQVEFGIETQVRTSGGDVLTSRTGSHVIREETAAWGKGLSSPGSVCGLSQIPQTKFTLQSKIQWDKMCLLQSKSQFSTSPLDTELIPSWHWVDHFPDTALITSWHRADLLLTELITTWHWADYLWKPLITWVGIWSRCLASSSE